MYVGVRLVRRHNNDVHPVGLPGLPVVLPAVRVAAGAKPTPVRGGGGPLHGARGRSQGLCKKTKTYK